jgi:hypothetical protein
MLSMETRLQQQEANMAEAAKRSVFERIEHTT